MSEQVDDLRIRAIRPLLPPAILAEEIPVTEKVATLVSSTRKAITKALLGEDKRLVVVIGPCSIHDPIAALEFGTWLKVKAEQFSDDLLLVMRTYFEKPRTTVGWKGLINDPEIDESFQINKGLRAARKLLKDLAEIGLPSGTEFLDTNVPQHIADLITWGAIGARTSESQIHRELASGLSMPIGFKNATDGNFRTAVDAVKAAQSAHWFPGMTKEGIAAILQTTGNDSCHVILRGGSRTGPNFDADHVKQVSEALIKEQLPHRLMVDCSHGNSSKQHTRQLLVAEDIGHQIADGQSPIFGVMVEANLVEGRQDYTPGQPSVYGQSITDACISIAQAEGLLVGLARSKN